MPAAVELGCRLCAVIDARERVVEPTPPEIFLNARDVGGIMVFVVVMRHGHHR
jgi:hypothetical protein